MSTAASGNKKQRQQREPATVRSENQQIQRWTTIHNSPAWSNGHTFVGTLIEFIGLEVRDASDELVVNAQEFTKKNPDYG